MAALTDAERALLAWLDSQPAFLPDCVTHEARPIGPAGVRYVPRSLNVCLTIDETSSETTSHS